MSSEIECAAINADDIMLDRPFVCKDLEAFNKVANFPAPPRPESKHLLSDGWRLQSEKLLEQCILRSAEL